MVYVYISYMWLMSGVWCTIVNCHKFIIKTLVYTQHFLWSILSILTEQVKLKTNNNVQILNRDIQTGDKLKETSK